jgi:hypothetical protein
MCPAFWRSSNGWRHGLTEFGQKFAKISDWAPDDCDQLQLAAIIHRR